MNQEHNNIKSKKFKQIKFRDRIVIETLRKQRHLASKIAEVLDFPKEVLIVKLSVEWSMDYGIQTKLLEMNIVLMPPKEMPI